MTHLPTLRLLAAALIALFAIPQFSVNADVAEVPSAGRLEALGPDGAPLGACPLERTDVDVTISAFISRVTLTQHFVNPYNQPIEAVYTFPMSTRAAVDSMTMRVGDRFIRGLIKDRDAARRIYQAAKNAGKAASLLDQERPNIFTQSVANILPGDSIEITISYVEYLKYEEGEYEFSFPMVVGPRYIPGGMTRGAPVWDDEKRQFLLPLPKSGTHVQQVPDAHRITPPVTPEGTRTGHDISLAVHLDAGVAIQDIRSELHAVEIWRRSSRRADIQLKDRKTIPNRDFVLRYAVAGEKVGDAVLTHADERGGFFTLILQPPARVAPESVTPKEMIFVIDCSGSMRGFPIEKAKEAMALAIDNMNPRDTFNLVSFAGGLGYCFNAPVANTEVNRKKALDYLNNLRGGGGTEMMKAIRAALGNQNDPDRLRVVCFMTDGFIGNDMAILDAIQRHAGTARVFAFGIGNGVNRFLIEGMGRTGRGASEVVTLESDAGAAAKRFHERIHSPLLTDITVDFNGLDIHEVYPDPAALPDLFASRPLILTGRYSKAGDGAITIRGNTAQGIYERTIAVNFPKTDDSHDVLAPLWARNKVAAVMEKDWMGIQRGLPRDDIRKIITDLGLEFGLVTQYTSFVAVEEKVINEGGTLRTIEVPVEMTDGVSYEGVFGDSRPAQKTARMNYRHVQSGKASNMAVGQSIQPSIAVGGAVVLDEMSRLPQTQPQPPRREFAAEAIEKEDDDLGRPRDKAKGSQKLSPDLQALLGRSVGANYENGPVKVVDGWVSVVILLQTNDDEYIKTLKKNGVKVVSYARSGKRVVARVQVKDLEKLAKLRFVVRITAIKL